jgi:hypothetical protein
VLASLALPVFQGRVDAQPAPALGPCIGDCSGDGSVTVDNLVTMVTIALGNGLLISCVPGDGNADLAITIDEIIAAVNNALAGCVGPTPTPTPDVPALATQIPAGPHDTVMSSDGRAELLIPPGALPSGVAVADIHVTSVDPAASGITIDGQPPLFVYQLEPDGIHFTMPVLLRISSTLSAGGEVPQLFLVSAPAPSLVLQPSTRRARRYLGA